MTATTTTIHRSAFGTLAEALAYVQGLVDNGTGGSTVQILVGSSDWPDPPRRYRVTLSVQAAGAPAPLGLMLP